MRWLSRGLPVSAIREALESLQVSAISGHGGMASREGISRPVPSGHSRMTRALGDGAGGCRRRDTPGVMRDWGLLRVFAVLRGGCGWRGPGF